MRLKKIALLGCVALAGLAAALALLVYALTYHPKPVERLEVFGGTNAPILRPGQKLRILTWNVQYMAGKNHVFFYEGGTDERPSSAEIAATLAEVARVIREEDPDIVLLQEVDDGSRRTDYENQATRLLALLPAEYRQHTSAFYHKAAFVPDPHILGAVGMKLVTLSKFRIREAVRHQLPLMPKDPLTRQFHFKRAILEARLPVAGGNDFVALNTHFDAWAAGTETMARQVALRAGLAGAVGPRRSRLVSRRGFQSSPARFRQFPVVTGRAGRLQHNLGAGTVVRPLPERAECV
jgi:endonuclease/exonuclease/phosphatase family metal-dependent hydrolase